MWWIRCGARIEVFRYPDRLPVKQTTEKMVLKRRSNCLYFIILTGKWNLNKNRSEHGIMICHVSCLRGSLLRYKVKGSSDTYLFSIVWWNYMVCNRYWLCVSSWTFFPGRGKRVPSFCNYDTACQQSQDPILSFVFKIVTSRRKFFLKSSLKFAILWFS